MSRCCVVVAWLLGWAAGFGGRHLLAVALDNFGSLGGQIGVGIGFGGLGGPAAVRVVALVGVLVAALVVGVLAVAHVAALGNTLAPVHVAVLVGVHAAAVLEEVLVDSSYGVAGGRANKVEGPSEVGPPLVVEARGIEEEEEERHRLEGVRRGVELGETWIVSGQGPYVEVVAARPARKRSEASWHC